jgi:hypothetical protein
MVEGVDPEPVGSLPPDSGGGGIGILQEKSLHAALKRWYARPGDLLEVRVDGYQVDIVRGDLLIEIQTRNFSAMKRKLFDLIQRHPIRLVYPIAREKWLLKQHLPGDPAVEKRRSPRRGRLEHLFLELVRFPQLVAHPNFSLEVLFIREEEIRVNDGRGAWRRKGWSIADRRLIEVVEQVHLEGPGDFRIFLPVDVNEPFTSRELARSRRIPGYLASKMLYCLREMGLVLPAGKRKRSNLYRTSGAE